MNITVITTFPNNMWEVYARESIHRLVKFWPAEVPFMVQLDDDLLFEHVDQMLRPQDGIAVGWEKDHAEFVARNKDKDSPTDYRKQAVRFCHKVFAIKRALDAALKQKEAEPENPPRYLIWMDADVHITRAVTMEEIKACLPKEGDALAYLGRKDWDHSECGWLAFDLENGGDKLIEFTHKIYLCDKLFDFPQWHDSWVWDQVFKNVGEPKNKITNLTEGKPGTEIWEQSPMAAWSVHYKGPAAKSKMFNGDKKFKDQKQQVSNIQIHTMNAIPNGQIHDHISKNQILIENWVKLCEATDDEVVVVSAGPMLVAEEVRDDAKAGKRIVAVKHALKPLKAAGITPWACILLDPRPHVVDFVKDADPEVIWFVASQVNPEVTRQLIVQGCTVWGYHASVGANEQFLTDEQAYSIIGGGSATATRGLYMLHHLGFRNFKLYGYDLCFPDKPDLEAKDERGQPKYLEFSLGMNDPLYNLKRCFWSEPQLIAQFEEMNLLLKNNNFKIEAIGDGILPFITKSQKMANLRNDELKAKIHGTEHPNYRDMLNGNAARPAGKRPANN